MKKMMIAASCALAVMASGVQADERELRIAFDVPYEPFEYKDENGDRLPCLSARLCSTPASRRSL